MKTEEILTLNALVMRFVGKKQMKGIKMFWLTLHDFPPAKNLIILTFFLLLNIFITIKKFEKFNFPNLLLGSDFENLTFKVKNYSRKQYKVELCLILNFQNM